ncbi:hypothetical protein GCM10020218_096070 [Dactylosporangium vinaceum]
MIWRAKSFIAAFAVVAGVAAALIAAVPATTYTAQSTIRVSLLSVKGVPREAVLAQNDLAAQYALLATTAPVLDHAAQSLGQSIGKIEATPLNGYNIVGITATAGSARLAAQRAEAVARALIFFVRNSETEAYTYANNAVAPQLKQLDEQIGAAQDTVEKLQSRLNSTDPEKSGGLQAQLSSQMALLGTLVSNRTNYFTAATRDAAAASPQLTLLNVPQQGTAKPKNALLYGLVAALVAALGAAEIAVLSFRLRTLQVAPRKHRKVRGAGPADYDEEEQSRPSLDSDALLPGEATDQMPR